MKTCYDHREKIFDGVDDGRYDHDLKEWKIRYHSH